MFVVLYRMDEFRKNLIKSTFRLMTSLKGILPHYINLLSVMLESVTKKTDLISGLQIETFVVVIEWTNFGRIQ